MTIPNVVTHQQITSAWGNQVANEVNDLAGRTTAMEAVGAGTRLTALEQVVARRGIWWVRTTNQNIPGLTTTIVTSTAVTEATTGFAVASGIVTIPVGAGGVYNVFAKVNSSSFLGGGWVVIDNVFDISMLGASDRGGLPSLTATTSLRLNAGQTVSVFVRAATASAVNVTAANVHLWRVSQ